MLTTGLILGQGLSPPASLVPINSNTLFLNKQAVISQRTLNRCCASGMGGKLLGFLLFLLVSHPTTPHKANFEVGKNPDRSDAVVLMEALFTGKVTQEPSPEKGCP